MVFSLLAKLSTLNLFHPEEGAIENEHQRHSNIIATRIYLGLMAVTLVSVSGVLWLRQTRTTVTIKYPTREQFEKLPATTDCPCSQFSFSYGTFIALEAVFHPVCSSAFISDRWIRTIFHVDSTGDRFYKSDFRTTGSAHFQALATLCHQSVMSVVDSLKSFYSTSFISSKVFHRAYLGSIVEASTKRFQLTVPFVFQSQLQLINDMTFSNQLIPALQTTLYISNQWIPGVAYVLYPEYWQYPIGNDTFCRCDVNSHCTEPLGFYSLNLSYFEDDDILAAPELLFSIPTLRAGCTTVTSLLQSTLECFYHQACLNSILAYASIEEHFTAMVRNETSIFQPDSTIQTMVDHIMVEEWTHNLSYEKYFDQCQPITCTYSIMEPGNWLYIMTKIVGLLGGLTMMLGLLTPLIVRTIRDRKLPNHGPHVSASVRMRRLIDSIHQSLTNMNLFKSRSQNECHIRYQRFVTRAYLIILFAAFAILFSYSLVKQEVHHQIINHPTESQYTYLKDIYSTSLACPCTHLSNSHEKFLSIQPIYHPICSSIFVSPAWITLMSMSRVLSDDEIGHRANPGTHFSVLATFCKYARKMVNDSVDVFLQTKFVSSHVIEQQMFDAQMYSLIEEWTSTTLNNFQRTIELIRETNQGNKLINDMLNINFLMNDLTYEITYEPLTYANCSCDLFGSCTMRLPPCAVINAFRLLQVFIVPEFFIGCYPVEALLKSKLICFYNQTCFEDLFRRINDPDRYPELYNASHLLNASDSQPNDTMETVVNKLMIKAWNPNVSFSSYYNACAPSQCTFEYTGRSQLLLIVITTITILGGLATGLKIFSLCILRTIENLTDVQRQNTIRLVVKVTFIFDDTHKLTDRLHFLLLLIALTIIYLVAFLNQPTMTAQILKPSLITYEALSETYPTTLRCACTDISLKYRTFVAIEPSFHPICSSEFMSNAWIMHLYGLDSYFHTATLGQYQLLISLCKMAKKTVSDALSQFRASDYIDAQLKSFVVLRKEIQLTMNDFQSSVSQSFLGILNLIRGTTAANMLMNIYSSNWKYEPIPLADDITYTPTQPVIHGGCNCGMSASCSARGQSVLVGCYPLEELVQSTLQCFYDQSCIDPSEHFKALNASFLSIRFHLNSTVESILQELMVDTYHMNISYEEYFTHCSPSSCQYSYSSYGDAIDIIISLIGLYGGLLVISRCLAVFMVKLYESRQQRHINPVLE